MYKIVFLLHNVQTFLFSVTPKNSEIIGSRHKVSSMPIVLFWVAIAIYPIYMLLTQADWLFRGEMWAEMGTNYFVAAQSDSLRTVLFATDYGYVPFPQRIIGLFGRLLQLNAATTAFYYNWVAVFLTSFFIAPFILPPFRRIISNDFLRFFVVIVLYMLVDFETRTYINFTYLSVFLITILAALAIVQRKEEVPVWAWVVPFLLFSKPVIFSVVPLLLVAVFVSLPRFRKIVLVSFVAFLAQIIVILGTKDQIKPRLVAERSFFEELVLSVKSFFVFLGQCFLGAKSSVFVDWFMVVGVVFFVLAIAVVVFMRKPGGVLIFAGFVLIFTNFFVLIFTKQYLLNFESFSISRYTVVAFIGFMLSLVGFIDVLVGWLGAKFFVNNFVGLPKFVGRGIFVVFVFFAGIFSLGAKISHTIPPFVGATWQKNAAAIDLRISPLCVPVLPLGWGIYGNDCRIFEQNIVWRWHMIHYPGLPGSVSNVLPLDLPSPDKGTKLSSLGVVVKSVSTAEMVVFATANIELKDGRQVQFVGDANVGIFGDFLQLSGREAVEIADIVSINVVTDKPVVFGKMSDTGQAAFIFMGR